MNDETDSQPDFVVSKFTSRSKAIGALLFLIVSSALWYYYEYHYTPTKDIPVLIGDSGPTRIKPEKNESPLSANTDKMLYDNFTNKGIKDHTSAVTIVPEPEQPIQFTDNKQNIFEDVISEIIAKHDTNNEESGKNDTDEFTKYFTQNDNENLIKTLNVISTNNTIQEKYIEKNDKDKILYYIQILSSRNAADAEKEWQNLMKSHSKTLNDYEHFVVKTKIKDREVFYRLLIGEFTKFSQAKVVCKKLMDTNKPCIVVKGK